MHKLSVMLKGILVRMPRNSHFNMHSVKNLFLIPHKDNLLEVRMELEEAEGHFVNVIVCVCSL